MNSSHQSRLSLKLGGSTSSKKLRFSLFSSLLPHRQQRLIKLYKLSKSYKSGSGGGGAAPRLKSVVRRLPPDLPEAIFWKSVEPWVIRENQPISLPTIADKENDNVVNEVVEAGSSQIERNPKAEKVVWSCFKSGKVRRSGKDKDDVHSRAYISFKTLEGLMAFSKGYDGWSFRDKNGNTSQAVVEFAPYQKIPLTPAKLDTRRQGGIEEDPDYINFLAVLSAPEPAKSDEIATVKKELPKSTPLLDHLRAQKATELATRKGLITFISSKVASTSKGSRQSSSKSSIKTSSSGGGTNSSNGTGTVENGDGKRSRRRAKETNATGGANASASGSRVTGGGAAGGSSGKSSRTASGKGRPRNGGGGTAVVQASTSRPSVPPLSAFPLLNSVPSIVIPSSHPVISILPYPTIDQQTNRSGQISQLQQQIRSAQQQINPLSERPPISIPFQSSSSSANSAPQIQIQQRQPQQSRQPPQISLLTRPPQSSNLNSNSNSQSQPRLNPPPLSNQLVPQTMPRINLPNGDSSGKASSGGSGAGGGGGGGGGGRDNRGGGGGGGRIHQPQGSDGAAVVAGQRRALGAALGAALGTAGGGAGGSAGGGNNRKRREPRAGGAGGNGNGGGEGTGNQNSNRGKGGGGNSGGGGGGGNGGRAGGKGGGAPKIVVLERKPPTSSAPPG